MLYPSFFIKKNSVLVTLTSYYSYNWTKICVSNLIKHIPNVVILLIDNNPSPEDDSIRRSSFLNYPYNSIGRIVENNSMRLLQKERVWLKSIKNLYLIKTDNRLWHGEAMNLAMDYAKNFKFDILIHIEPDCIIYGYLWYQNLIKAIKDGAWMASGVEMPDGCLHPCPSAWSVKDVCDFDFMHTLKKTDYFDPEYPFLVNLRYSNQYEITYWDTAKKAWYECAKKNKTQLVDITGIKHIWAKSSSEFSNFMFF
jgi:hypothetical protein